MRKPCVVVFGMRMPPVHGAALVTAYAVDLFETHGADVVWISRNVPSMDRNWTYYLRTIRNLGRSLVTSLRHRRRADSVYVTCSGGLGVVAEGIGVLLARRRRTRLVVHHHGVAYLVKRSLAFRAVNAVAFRGAIHVALCDQMVGLLGQAGVPADRVRVISNVTTMDLGPTTKTATAEPSCAVDPSVGLPARADAGLRLGHVSNLSIAKGLDLLLDLLELCGTDVQLILCGHPQDDVVAAMVRDAVVRFEGRLLHVAPAERSDVWAFLRDIDAFVYPTHNDAAPLVVLEALSAGVPVIATSHGCIPSQLAPEMSDLVLEQSSWVQGALAVVQHWASDRSALDTDRARALRQWEHLQHEADQHRDELVALVIDRAASVR
jgi:glycosyltransferase involved in cell wall biosynthesis